MIRVGELFGFPVYTDPVVPRGEIGMIGAGPGFDVLLEDGMIVVRRRTVTVKVVGLEQGDESRPTEAEYNEIMATAEPLPTRTDDPGAMAGDESDE